MAGLDKGRIESALAGIQDRYLNTDLVSAGVVRTIEIDSGKVAIHIDLGFPVDGYREDLAQLVRERVEALEGVESAFVEVEWEVIPHGVQRPLERLPGVKNIIAVASGKGGVGKSTTAVNLALALAHDGARVGLLDADIYGPSQPRMLGVSGRPGSPDGKHIEPMKAHGISCMSIGFLIDEETPMVWRGPMVTQALSQLIHDTLWPDLDYLIVDMPPGTGDVQLTLSQRVPVSGAVIVTTPQEISLLDARKGLKMFQKVEVGILGVVENMSVHVCENCGHEQHIFGADGGRHLAEQYGVPYLGGLPLDESIREQADGGNPTVAAAPNSPQARLYIDVARRMAAQMSLRGRGAENEFPTIIVED